ncbi:MAG: sel1 repeat family protein [Gammaproteobacteria bacterium]|nr:sel1 repeat family protein [Gammaproteobacteria bacterium]
MINFEKILQASLQGETGATRLLRSRIDKGKLSLQELSRCIECFDEEIANKNSHAMYLRACMHETGQGGEVNYAAADSLFFQAQELGNSDAICRIACSYYTEGNYRTAFDLFKQVINKDPTNRAALYFMAWMHHKGEGCSQNTELAIPLFDKAIELGHAEAMNAAGCIARDTRKYPKAIALFDRAIKLKNVSAMINRAGMHEENEKWLEAVKLYRRAYFQSSDRKVTDYAARRIQYINRFKISSLEIQYTASLVGANDSYLNTHPNKFLNLLASEDASLHPVGLNFFVKNFPSNGFDRINQANIDFIASWYLTSANQELQKRNIAGALSLYSKVPSNSGSRGAACYGMGIHIYQNTLQKNNDEINALEKAKQYLEEGSKLGDLNCIEFYTKALQSIINPDMKEDSTDDLLLESLKLDYEALVDLRYTSMLKTFTDEHKLTHLNFWADKAGWFEGTDVTFNDKKITVPKGIAVIYDIINDPIKTSFEKITALSTAVSLNDSWFALVKPKYITKDCYMAASNLLSLITSTPLSKVNNLEGADQQQEAPVVIIQDKPARQTSRSNSVILLTPKKKIAEQVVTLPIKLSVGSASSSIRLSQNRARINFGSDDKNKNEEQLPSNEEQLSSNEEDERVVLKSKY